MNTIRRHIHRLSGGHHDPHGQSPSTNTPSSTSTSASVPPIVQEEYEDGRSAQMQHKHSATSSSNAMPSQIGIGRSSSPSQPFSPGLVSPGSQAGQQQYSYTVLEQQQHDMNRNTEALSQMSLNQMQRSGSSDSRAMGHSPVTRSHGRRPSTQSRRSYQYEQHPDNTAHTNANMTFNNWEGDVVSSARSPPTSANASHPQSRSPVVGAIPITKMASSPATYAVQHQRQLSNNSAISQQSRQSMDRRSPSPAARQPPQSLPNDALQKRPSLARIDTSPSGLSPRGSFDRKPLSASAVMDGSPSRDRHFENQNHLTVASAQSPIGIPASQVLLGRKPSKNNVGGSGGDAGGGAGRRRDNDDKDMTVDERLVQEGIQYHEQNELEKATDCFKRAAELSNPNGMFLYGISLRHGWGCETQPTAAFKYLQKAAESAVVDISNGKIAPGVDALNSSSASGPKAVVAKKELVLAIHELGVCFRHGWGVPKNKQTAVYYFELAANMGDPDAQNDLGFCYYHGEGVKRDLYKAAKYYRLAHKQGVTVMGNSWIFKKKYDNCGA